MSSYYCGKHVWYNMCRHNKESCTGENINSGAGHHRNPDVSEVGGNDFDDELTWMEMGPYNPAEVGAITMFRYGHCHGRTTRVYWNPPTDDQGVSTGGRYNLEDLEELGMLKDDITSFMLPKGYYVHMYHDPDLWNYLDYFEGRYKDDFTQEMECRDLRTWDNRDNRLESLMITKAN